MKGSGVHSKGMFEVLRACSTSCGILNSVKKFASKPCLKPMVVGNFSKNLKPCRLNKPNTIHCKI